MVCQAAYGWCLYQSSLRNTYYQRGERTLSQRPQNEALAFDTTTVDQFGEATFFRTLLANTTDGILTIDETSTIVFANPAVHDIFGYAPADLVGESLLMLIPPDLQQQHLDAVAHYLQTGERSFDWDGIHLSGQHRDGQTVPLEIAFQEHDREDCRLFTGVIREITDQKAREEELERYETLVETADDGIYQLDSNGRFVAVNDVVTEITGYSRDQLLGESVSLVLDEDDIAKCIDVIQTQLASGDQGDQPLELDIRTANGHTLPGELRLNVLQQDGDFRGTVGIVRDITDRKQAEAERQLLHATTRSIAEADTTEDGLNAVVTAVCEMTEWVYGEAWMPTADGSHLERTTAAYTVSEAFDQFKERSGVAQFDSNEGLPGRVWATHEPEWLPNVAAVSPDVFVRADTAAEVGLKAGLGVPVISDDRVVAVLAFYMTEEKPQDDRLMDIVSTTATNLGTLVQRKQQEDALKQHRKELVRRRDQLQTELNEIFDRVNEAFFGLNTEWEITYVNPRAEAALQHSADELIGQHIWDAFPAAADSTFQEQYEYAMETQTAVTFEEYYDPLESWFEVRAYPSETGLSVYFRDITERKESEHELKRQNERLDHFASMLAHELRNPVNIGQIYSQQLPAEADQEAVEYITEAFDRIEAMIDVMLVVTRGDEAVAESAPIQLADVAREAWDDVDTAEATLEVTVDKMIRGDETYIRHLFRNLFENAVVHGGADVTVTVGELPTGFYVADDGAGIPADDREAVLEAGYTTAASKGGTGLGLAFVRELAEVYEWDYLVTDSEDGGARFEFRNIT